MDDHGQPAPDSRIGDGDGVDRDLQVSEEVRRSFDHSMNDDWTSAAVQDLQQVLGPRVPDPQETQAGSEAAVGPQPTA